MISLLQSWMISLFEGLGRPKGARRWAGANRRLATRLRRFQSFSHSGLLEPFGTSTVLKAPGVFDRMPWSVMP